MLHFQLCLFSSETHYDIIRLMNSSGQKFYTFNINFETKFILGIVLYVLRNSFHFVKIFQSYRVIHNSWSILSITKTEIQMVIDCNGTFNLY